MNYLKSVINNIKNGPKGLIILLIFYFGFFLVVLTKTLKLIKELITLIESWTLPDKIEIYETAFLKIDDQNKVIVLFCLLVATLISYLFVIVSTLKLNRATQLFSANEIFLKKVSNDFKISSRFFLGFILITFGINISIVIITDSLQATINSFSIYTLYTSNISVYIVIYALLLFISDILGRGTSINEENKLTI